MDTVLISQLILNVLLKGYEAASGKITDAVLSKTGEDLFSYLKEKFTSPAQQETLTNFAKDSTDNLNQEALVTQLKMALRQDPDFQRRLETMIPQSVIQQVGDTTGDDNIIIIAHGSTMHVAR